MRKRKKTKFQKTENGCGILENGNGKLEKANSSLNTCFVINSDLILEIFQICNVTSGVDLEFKNVVNVFRTF